MGGLYVSSCQDRVPLCVTSVAIGGLHMLCVLTSSGVMVPLRGRSRSLQTTDERLISLLHLVMNITTFSSISSSPTVFLTSPQG